MRRTARPRRQAFTLIELLVVVSIIALLIALLMPALANTREAGRSGLCLSSLHQLGTSLSMYAADSSNRLPFDNWRGAELSLGANQPAGWLYDFTVRDPTTFNAADPQQAVIDHAQTGSLWPYLGAAGLYRCASDPPRPWDGTLWVQQMSSYPMNGAVGKFGQRMDATYHLNSFQGDSVIFWEVATSIWWDGSDSPNQGMLARHMDNGNVGCADGSAESWSLEQYELERTIGPSRLWCVPGSPSGH